MVSSESSRVREAVCPIRGCTLTAPPSEKVYKLISINKFLTHRYLPQTHEAYTALAVVELNQSRFVVRQTDVIKGQVIAEHDSEPMLYEDAVETFKVAVAEFI